MKSNLSITFLQILFLIGLQSFAFDSGSKTDFDFKFLTNTFTVTDIANCSDSRFHNAEIKVSYHSGKNEIEIYANETLLQVIKYLNVGKTEFSFCWSEGTKGFYQNEFFANKIIFKKAIYATGTLCTEGSRIRLEEQELSFTLEGLDIKTKIVDDKNNQTMETGCHLSISHSR